MHRVTSRSARAVRPNMVVAASPGTLNAPADSHDSAVDVMAYGKDELVEADLSDLASIAGHLERHAVVWVNVVGLGTVEVIEQIGELFDLHRLALEDVLNIPQRPKVDDFGSHLYVVARMPTSRTSLESEQLSIFVGEKFVVTVQERAGDCLDPIRARLREGRPRIRGNGADYLAYCILDALVDAYFPVLESLGTNLDELEDVVLGRPGQDHVRRLHDIKRDLVPMRRFLWPLQELITNLLRQENSFFTDQTRMYLRDCQDHSRHALDLVDSYRDVASGLMDLYLSLAGQRMNEVMKVLTIIATIFIPLSFIAGLYGMNFDPDVSAWNMPELAWRWGYPMALGLMLACATAMLAYFWRKGWFR